MSFISFNLCCLLFSVQIAELLRGRLRDNDILARLGGDEFVALIRNTNRKSAQEIATSLLTKMQDFTFYEGVDALNIYFSVGITVINDAYNANPESMAAAVRTLISVAAGRRSWAVLGAMRELGADAAAEHASIGRLAGQLGVDRRVAAGPDAAALLAGDLSSTVGIAGADVDEALALLAEQASTGDVVLVKASRSEGLERIAGALVGSRG